MSSTLSVMFETAFAAGERRELTTNDHKVLDATLDLVQRKGIDGFTVADVAARARLNRVTVFRRFGSKDEMLQQMVTRELDNFRDQLHNIAQSNPDAQTVMIEGFALSIKTARTHPLVRSLADHDPAWLLETLRSPRSAILSSVRAGLAATLSAVETHSPSALDPVRAADILLHLVVAYTFTPEADPPLDDDADLAAFAKSIVAGLVSPH